MCRIGWNSLYLIWNAGNDLMDPSLPDHEIATVIEAIERADPAVVNYRDLRTRRAAGVRFIEFELCIDRASGRADAYGTRMTIADFAHGNRDCGSRRTSRFFAR